MRPAVRARIGLLVIVVVGLIELGRALIIRSTNFERFTQREDKLQQSLNDENRRASSQMDNLIHKLEQSTQPSATSAASRP